MVNFADFEFLMLCRADFEALQAAAALAHQTAVPFLTALFAAGPITEDVYAARLAAALALPIAFGAIEISDATAASILRARRASPDHAVDGAWRGTPVVFICATAASPAIITRRVAGARSGMPDKSVVLVTGRALNVAAERARSQSRVRAATHALRRNLPRFSAGRAGPAWQPFALSLAPGFLVGGLLTAPQETIAVLTPLLALPFAGTVLVRLAAMLGQMQRPAARRAISRTTDAELPVYTILVALYEESAVLPKLVAALAELDWPAAKLDCLLVIEDGDAATKWGFLQADLPAWMRVVIVPDGNLRTKPRALNYALKLARGEYVVIYDAEDRPEPDQLRRAYAAFQTAGPKVACVQACLNIFNARQSWLTRQFTVEYSALFDAILPALQRLRLPIPLGGTSNHFRRAMLEDMHGWDPYNVTEDADLGIRIARLGYAVTVIPSTTWEEAPPTFRMWLRQRTRWLKGWMQTYLVHTRHPIALLRDLGFARTLGFHVYLGGLILSALVHPLFYAAVIADLCFDLRAESYDAGLGQTLLVVAVINLAAGYLSSIIVGIVAARRRGHRLTLTAVVMPFYWLLISLAAYRALWQLYWDPYLWEKTPHGLADES